MARKFRELYRWLTPGWLNEDETDGGRILYSLALLKDAFMQRFRESLEIRFPSRTQASAQHLTGVDRGILRGRNETNAHYAQRLIAWRYPRGHRVRGNAFGLLEQVSEYFGGAQCFTIDVKGTECTWYGDGTTNVDAGLSWNWDGVWSSGQPARRFWVIVDLSTADSTFSAWEPVGSPTLWGGTVGNKNVCVGIKGMTPADGKAIRGLCLPPRPWKPSGVRAERIVYSLDGSYPTPDGTWDTWQGRAATGNDFRFGYLRKTPR